MKPMFEDWDLETYAHFLAYYTEVDVSHLYVPPDKTMTWLHDEQERPQFINFTDYPILPRNPGS